MRARARIGSHPIHPMLVAFPIALWVTSLIFDIIGLATGHYAFWAAGFYAMVAGIVGAACAAIAGSVDLFTIVPPNSTGKRRGYQHAILNAIVMLIFLGEEVWRGTAATKPSGWQILTSLVALAILGFSGWMGGTLVYRNQIGVDHRYAHAGQWKERSIEGWDKPVCNRAELAEGQMMLATIEGERIVVGRCGDGYFAISDHCTHRGGPLSDGALIGCTVQCPWHGSQFDVHSGRVVTGPANSKIKTFNIKMRGEEVYVSPDIVIPPSQAA